MKISTFIVSLLIFSGCIYRNSGENVIKISNMNLDEKNAAITDTATFGAGCFWCTEAVFEQLAGVISVTSGYSGGFTKNPTYREVCSGNTGYAEVSQIVFDPSKISFADLLEVFWTMHDPTTLNRQGADEGTQYRSVIFYHSDKQRLLAEDFKKKLNDENVFNKPIVTEITPYKAFYPAEDYHQQYLENNPNQPYCRLVVIPKVEKIREVFRNKLKN